MNKLVLALLGYINISLSEFLEVKYLEGKSEECQSVANQVQQEHTQLQNCYAGSSLYFSTISKVCSKECLEPTTKAAAKISAACPPDTTITASDTDEFIGNTEKRTDIYSRWSNMTINQIACAKFDSNNYCLDLFHMAHETVNNMNTNPNTDKSKLCSECTRQLYNALQTSHREPTLYYWSFKSSDKLFTALSQHCGY